MRSTFAFKKFVAEAGLEPATFGLCVPLQLSLLPAINAGICNLDFLFTLFLSEVGCPPLSLYTFPDKQVIRTWLGIATPQGSPNLTDNHPGVSARTALARTVSAQLAARCIQFGGT